MIQSARAALFCITLFLLAVNEGRAQEAGVIQRLTADSLGGGGNGNSISGTISANGQFFAFDSLSDNLTTGDTNTERDIFVKNIQTGQIRLVTRGRFNTEANGPSRFPQLTPVAPNGFFAVVYESLADNIGFSANGDSNGDRDIYMSLPGAVRSLRVTRGVNGGPANGPSFGPSTTVQIEPNRIVVAYSSRASNLTEDVDTNAMQDIFVTTYTNPDSDDFDLANNVTTVRVSKAADGGVADGASTNAKISGDGKWIAFQSDAQNLISNLTPTTRQVYLYEVATGQITLVSRTSNGAPGAGISGYPSINYDGSYITYITNATDVLEDGKDTTHNQVVRYHRIKNSSKRVNVTKDGIVGNGTSTEVPNASISPNGRFVVFGDNATNLVENDTNGVGDVFLKDMVTDELYLISKGLSGAAADGASGLPLIAGESFTGNTELITFTSEATNLVSGDSEGVADIFQVSFTVPALPLKAGTSLQVPPDVELGEKNAILSLEKLKGFTGKIPRASSEVEVQYEVDTRIEGKPKNKQDRTKTISKRNKVTVRKLKPDVVYKVKYKAQAVQNSKVIAETKFSPEVRFSLGG